jgi:1,4-dihydroxy-2-naphthoyl-CoA hydrolase
MTNRIDLDSLKEKEGLLKDLGIEYVETKPERVVMTMPVDVRHQQPLGYLHGGANVVLAESVATVGACLNCPPGKVVFGSEDQRQSSKAQAFRNPYGSRNPDPGRAHEPGLGGSDTRRGEKLGCVSRCRLAVVDD